VADVTRGWGDDDELLRALGDALRAGDSVPRSFTEAAEEAYSWHDLDAALAVLTYDSAQPEFATAMTRADSGALRTFTFEAPGLALELYLYDEALRGQVVPARPGELEVHCNDTVVRVAVDEVGYFRVAPVPAGLFRLYFRAVDGRRLLTGWMSA
jgi:hypothetical protein